MTVIKAEELTDFSTRLLQAGGFSQGDARETADLLVWANLRGIDSHGVLRIPRYIKMVAERLLVPGGAVTLVREYGAIAVLDGGKCPGAVGMNAAVRKSAELAGSHGVGWCAARSISHAGAIGYFTSALAARGLVGLAMTASKPLMSYHGARGEAVSTNPLSIAVPTGDGDDPIVLDMSTAAVALGKILAAKDAGKQIPGDWAIDENGAPTTDPGRVAALLPMAGPKGSGLSLMIEILTSVLAGNAVIGPVLAGRRKGGFNGLVIAVDPAAFGSAEDFRDATSELRREISALEPAHGNDRVTLPGERSANIGRRRAVEGIPLAAGTARRLRDEAIGLGVEFPGAFA
ncbi:Ldh family oxidoreductase [Antarcticirhabdus aurantiaca]|uniref:Ldh family oxidoreductase n=1 Tax=Antarcticirhabdus aurantiaca TaxID=2606717 RepID=A0ACD4NNE4_9HYPH|nr:Ldh family oxidoreductase [Antarcticirhabdus aurantiaca]WAJ28374.1 Ldh family oxidoreductase [Jeongeuplla avenae]